MLGRDIDPFLPRGPQGPLWHGLMNEIQMLFHTHAVNDARNDAGRPTINSLWFWGGGLRPEFSHPRFDRIITDDLLTRALGKSTNIPVFNVSTLPDSLDALEEGHTLVVWHKCALALQEGSWEPWCQAHASLEQQCWQPLQQRIQSKTLTSLILHPLSGTHYQWPGGPWWRAWRRKPLSRYLPS